MARLYRLFLTRGADAWEVDEKRGRPWLRLVEEFLSSEERQHVEARAHAGRLMRGLAAFSVHTEASADELEMLFRRTQEYWRQAGSAPESVYWSVLTADPLRDPSPAVIRSFYETGREVAEQLIDAASKARPGFALEHAAVLDFGCGVGRVLRHFVNRAARCEGWDFSGSHLDVLEQNFKDMGVEGDFRLRVMDSIEVASASCFDLVFSVLVLQHNPPPLMAHLLRSLLRLVAPGGVALVHVPTAQLAPEYRFSIEDYRSTRPRDMEMHAIPREAMFRIADEEGMRVSSTSFTDWCGGDVLSELVAFTRP